MNDMLYYNQKMIGTEVEAKTPEGIWTIALVDQVIDENHFQLLDLNHAKQPFVANIFDVRSRE